MFMKTQNLYLKGGAGIAKNIVVRHYETSSSHLDVASIILGIPSLLFIEVGHDGINTSLHLSSVTPYELWYFDSKGLFTGKGFSHHAGVGPFTIVTQARFILLVGRADEEWLRSFIPTSFSFSTVTLLSEGVGVEGDDWSNQLSLLNDGALIAAYNKETRIRSWTSSRAEYLSCLQQAILSRDFNSDLLFTKDATGNVLRFSLANPVTLRNGGLVIVPE